MMSYGLIQEDQRKYQNLLLKKEIRGFQIDIHEKNVVVELIMKFEST
jgi:hypothetical protein